MKEEKIVIDGLDISYKIAGQGEPLLIWHGWGGSSDSWQKVQEILSRNFQVISLDLPGFGKSSNPPQPWKTDDYLNILLKFAEQIGLKGFYLVGHSFGGGLAAKFSAQNPQKVRALVLTGAAIFRSKKRLNWRQKIASGLTKVGSVFEKMPLIGKSLYPLARRFIYRFAGVHDYSRASGVMKETFKNIISEDLSDCLPQIKSPTLILWGKEDKSTPLEEAFAIQKLIPNSQIKVIEKANHSPHLTQPETTAESIFSFFNKKTLPFG
ncbi:MAG: alpha/beta hydrolase [Candidatus Paceibacterota bacterium]|jgi:pimeloyl-ACP methyl ester carboxylesterase